MRCSRKSVAGRGSGAVWLAAVAVLCLIPAARALADKGATVTIYQQSQNPAYAGYGTYGGYNYGGYAGVSTTGSFAVVVERRNLSLKKGTNDVSFDGVASQIDPATVQFKSKTDPKGTSVVEQKFVYDLASPDALLAKYVDKEITVVTDSGEINGRLLSFDARQLVVKTGDRKHPVRIVQRGEHVRDIRFGALDEALVTEPTLNWKIKTAKAGSHTAEVTYRTAGLAWRADYTAIYDSKKGKVDLSGWVSLTNRAGTSFDNADVILVTGNLQKPTATPNYAYGAKPLRNAQEMQVFALENPTSLEDRATVQLELFNPVNGTTAKEVLVYEALANTFYNSGYPNLDCYSYQYQAAKSHSDQFIELSALESKKGLTFPEGRARVFKKGKQGALELIGEDLLKPGTTGGTIRLRVGSSETVKGERRQLDCRPDDRAKQMREKIELKLTNTSKRPVQVVIREYMQRWSNWSIESESEKGKRAGQLAQEWRVKIPKKGSKTISYTVLYTW